jgi:hypothetical protein
LPKAARRTELHQWTASSRRNRSTRFVPLSRFTILSQRPNQAPPVALFLPSRYDESPASSSEPTLSENDESSSSGDSARSPRAAATPLPMARRPTVQPLWLDIPHSSIPRDVCRDYYRSGTCWRESSCVYRHMRPTNVAPSQANIQCPPHARPGPTVPLAPLGSSPMRDPPRHEPTLSKNPMMRSRFPDPGALDIRTVVAPPCEAKTNAGLSHAHVRLPPPTSRLHVTPHPTLSPPHRHAPLVALNGPAPPPVSFPTHSVIPRNAAEEDLMLRGKYIPDGYCYEWVHRGACIRSPRCIFKHELPQGWKLRRPPASGLQPGLLASRSSAHQPRTVQRDSLLLPTFPTKAIAHTNNFLPSLNCHVEGKERPTYPSAHVPGPSHLAPAPTPPRGPPPHFHVQDTPRFRGSAAYHVPHSGRLECNPPPGLPPSTALSLRPAVTPFSGAPSFAQASLPARHSLNSNIAIKNRHNIQPSSISATAAPPLQVISKHMLLYP